jgi:hypothetical protein
MFHALNTTNISLVQQRIFCSSHEVVGMYSAICISHPSSYSTLHTESRTQSRSSPASFTLLLRTQLKPCAT